MSQDDWRELLLRYAGEPRCEAHGCTDNLTVDHIRPRADGGPDDLSNLQFLCRSENSRKGPRDDAYWGKRFYWDDEIDISKLRTAQRVEAWEKVLAFADWFSQPWSQIARRLYTLAWVIGAGKTLAIPTLAWALNHVVRRDCGTATRRVDKVLVLCKEQSIRDQIVRDLSDKITAFGIGGGPPRVRAVEYGSLFDERVVIDQADVWVSCIHMLYEKNGNPRRGLERALALFPLIVIDEPHYATAQALKIVDAAATSLCFGLTGTPIDAAGDALSKFVLFSQFPYQSAVEYDQSLKWISASPEHQRDMVEEIGIGEAEVLRPEDTYLIGGTDEIQSYDLQLEPAKSVVERVIQYVSDSDLLGSYESDLAPHRPDEFIPNNRYPLHALIKADTIKMGETLVQTLNERFENSRSMFPRERGYAASLVHAPFEDEVGTRPGLKLTPGHPWMAAKNNGGRLTPESERFLVVVGIGREGVDNPYCGVVGVAGISRRTREIVQRPIGRQARSVRDGMSVPPARLDTIKIITHVAFSNLPAIVAGLKFVTDMPSYLEAMPTMEQLMDGLSPIGSDSVIGTAALSTKDRLRIAAGVGEQKERPEEGWREKLVIECGGDNPERRRRVEDWIDEVEQEPEAAWRVLHHHEVLEPVPVVVRESPTYAPTEADIVRFTKIQYPHLIEHLARLADPAVGALLATLYQQHAQQFHLPDVRSAMTLDGIRKHMARELIDGLGADFAGEPKWVHIFTGAAVKKILGVPDGQAAKTGGRYDSPQCHVILTRPEVRQRMLGYVRRKLIERGYCPNLAAAFGVPVHEPTEDDDADTA